MKIPKEISIAESKSNGARFYKCALQVNPFSYIEYRGKSSIDETEYITKCSMHLKKTKLRLLG
jgi:hypothetical protein